MSWVFRGYNLCSGIYHAHLRPTIKPRGPMLENKTNTQTKQNKQIIKTKPNQPKPNCVWWFALVTFLQWRKRHGDLWAYSSSHNIRPVRDPVWLLRHSTGDCMLASTCMGTYTNTHVPRVLRHTMCMCTCPHPCMGLQSTGFGPSHFSEQPELNNCLLGQLI